MLEVGAGSIQSVGVILAWGLACFIRWIQLQILIHQTHETILRTQIEAEVRADIETEQ